MGSTAGVARVCAVLGDPVEHSLSPVLHTAAYRALGLDWEYRRHRLDEVGLAGFVAGLGPEWRGLSLTMPLKQAVLELGEPDEVVRSTGAGNTLLLDEPRQVRNTDVPGLAESLRRAGAGEVGRALLLGTGATARSAVAALASLGCRRLEVIARRPERAAPLRRQGAALGLDVAVHPWPDPGVELPRAEVAVSTVVAGAADPLAPAVAAACPVVFDVVYDPWPTVLAGTAAAAGCRVASGLDLLVHQAVAQVVLMTGQAVPAELLLAAGRAALGRASSG